LNDTKEIAMDLEHRVKELEQRIIFLEDALKSHDGELLVISDEMNRPGEDDHPSFWDLMQKAKEKGWFE
jgi:hypothetical protein